MRSQGVILENFWHLNFVFPEGEITNNNICYLPDRGILLEKSIQGVDFSNRSQLSNFLKTINYFTDDRKYTKIIQFQGNELALCKYISVLRLKYYSVVDDPVVYLSQVYAQPYLDRVNYVRHNVKDPEKFLTDTFYFLKKVLCFDQYMAYKEILLQIRSRIDKRFVKSFQIFGDEYDIYLFQSFLRD